MAKSHVIAIAAGLLLGASGSSLAAKRITQASDAKGAVHSQFRATESSGLPAHSQDHDPYSNSRDPDPYAFGVNWPKDS